MPFSSILLALALQVGPNPTGGAIQGDELVRDVAARADRSLAHSGVHAVFAGPVLAANLRQMLTGETPRAAYNPRANSLYLINTGDGSAIASYGPFSAEGRWVLALKHRIDKAWIAKYAALGDGV